MHPPLRNRLLAAAGTVVAVIAGWQIANGDYGLASLLGGGILFWLAMRLTGVRGDALLAGLLLAGYIVGNRGFAQLSVPRLPLLVGELTLGIGLGIAIWHAVVAKTLPVRRDALNLVLLTWLAFGFARLPFDMRAYGAMALRDFALLYYALFFFLAQAWATGPAERRWLERCLTLAFAAAPPVFLAFARWPDFFTSNITLGGVPLVFIKSDVEGGLMVAGMYWFLQRYVTRGQRRWLVPAAASFGAVAVSNSRAALVALGVSLLWPLVTRDFRRLRPLAAMAALGLLGLSIQTAVTKSPFASTPLYRLYESTASIVDTRGERVYLANDLDDKPDNNQFRLVWWRAVADEVWADDRWLGLGFGHDLAENFLRVYYGTANDDFSARSPHNFALTVFGRMGLAGAALFAALLVALCALLWRAGRRTARGESDGARFTLALGAFAILVSACFGVVLEGPMGATVFWILLGLANATPLAATSASAPAEADESLRLAEPAAS
ncbi:MAG TPA: O-antigen ligase family protein [Opitutaceae bacterium]|nr:O-antigen ligase family protein [Opitutaceae bacterium]